MASLRFAMMAPLALTACGVLIPDARTPTDRAHALEARCRSATDAEVAPLLAPSAIDSVEPAYSYVQSGSGGREPRLQGARIHVRPVAGASKESMTRALECHEARVVLGAAAPPLDPYVLPDRWLDLGVQSEGDGFVVEVRADAFDDARVVLDRAQRFAASR